MSVVFEMHRILLCNYEADCSASPAWISLTHKTTDRETPTFCKWDDNQGSVHEDCVCQVLGYANRVRLEELYKTDTWSHRQGRITGRKYKCFCKKYKQGSAEFPVTHTRGFTTRLCKIYQWQKLFHGLLWCLKGTLDILDNQPPKSK